MHQTRLFLIEPQQSLFGMNVDILANNPAWWWYPLLAGGVTVFTFAMWIIFKMSETVGTYNHFISGDVLTQLLDS